MAYVAATNAKLPVIDLAHLEGDGRGAIVEEIERACQDWGFFQIVNHGVSSDVMKGAVDIALQFFTLSTDEKRSKCSGDVVGDDYQLIGYGTRYCSAVDPVVSGRECVRHLSNPEKPFTDVWPDKPTSYREVISAFCEELRSLASRLLPAISESLGVAPDFIAKAFDNANATQITVLNHYPPCANPDVAIGFAAHSDGTPLTIVLQQEDVSGLQIRRNGEWVDAKPIKGALAIIIGDEMEVWTNGRYKAVQHRALVNALRSRVSIATAWCEGGVHFPRPPLCPPP